MQLIDGTPAGPDDFDTEFLDYILAFAMVGLMGFARHFSKSLMTNVLLGTVLAIVARFVMHLISGMIYFMEEAVWVDLPTPNAFVYSLIYQLVYIPGDAVICLIVLAILVKTNVLQTLLHIMRPSLFPAAARKGQAAAESAAPADAPAQDAPAEKAPEAPQSDAHSDQTK